MRRARLLVPAVAIACCAVPGAVVDAHTETDFVAVPADSEATVTLKPTHGCGEAATVEVRIRAPLEDAEAVAVDGWTETSQADDEGNTILSWSGGVLPADEAGSFPVTFTVPSAVGELLTFPAVQRCENGDELAWIDGDPESEYPAPRLLVLPADAQPAASIDDVPADAPGRDQLTAVIDIDNPTASSVPAASVTTDVTTTS